MEKEFLERQLAEGRSLEYIGKTVGKHPSTVAYWVNRYGLIPIGRAKHASIGSIPRDLLEELISSGLSVAQIGATLGRNRTSVRYWLERYDLKTERAMRRGGLIDDGPQPRSTNATCRKHGRTRFVLEGRGYYRCARCRMEAVAKRRRKVKQILVREAGGKCALCGFDRHPAALEFHHVDPAQKSFSLSLRGITRSIDKLRAEAKTCVLLRSNCHALVEVDELKTPPAGSEPA